MALDVRTRYVFERSFGKYLSTAMKELRTSILVYVCVFRLFFEEDAPQRSTVVLFIRCVSVLLRAYLSLVTKRLSEEQ